jgi:NAD(P)-dependent dehydrogenase (short-subunit alcohol dehydrogenase family)
MSPVMIVTGGGRGIGAATVRLAAARGYSVLFSYGRDDASARRVVEETEASGQRVASVKADMGDESEIERLFALCDREFGRLDALINNAGIIGSRPEVIDIEGADLRRVLEVNVQGTFLACREAMRRMARSRGGRGGVIVNVSSRASQHGGAGVWVHYAASKGAIDTLTIGLSKEAGPEGVRVNAVRPGLIQTEIHARAGAPDRLQAAPNVPLGRAGLPEEVAETILWVASDAASYLAGSIIDVAGGR